MVDDDARRGGFREGAGRKLIPRRKCDYTIHLWEKANHHKNIAITAYCGSWACPRCHEYNKQKWISHILARTIFGKPGDWSHQASVFVTSDSAWNKSVKKLLNRRNVDFARIRMTDGKFAIINNGGVGDLLSDEEFDSKIKTIFSAIGDGRKPVTTSEGWELPYKVSSSRWVRLNNLNLTIQQLQDKLAMKGLHSEYLISDIEGIVFEYPGTWTEEELKEFARYLASLPGKFK